MTKWIFGRPLILAKSMLYKEHFDDSISAFEILPGRSFASIKRGFKSLKHAFISAMHETVLCVVVDFGAFLLHPTQGPSLAIAPKLNMLYVHSLARLTKESTIQKSET